MGGTQERKCNFINIIIHYISMGEHRKENIIFFSDYVIYKKENLII